MSKLSIGKALTNEEKFLREKYKVLRAKKEQLRKSMTMTVPKADPIVVPNRSSQTSCMDAKEKAKMLLMSGKITIPQQDKTTGFKRAKVLERKLCEGQRTVEPKLPPPPPVMIQPSNNGKGNIDERSSNLGTRGFKESSLETSHESESHFKGSHHGESSSRALSSCSTAASEWRNSIDRYQRNRNRGYFDYKRRVITYSSSDSDDN